MKALLLVVFCLGSLEVSGQRSGGKLKQRYDGWYNNLDNPYWGSKDSTLLRKVPPRYEDGVYTISKTRPSARVLSKAIFSGPGGLPSLVNRTVMLMFFGQLVSSEILLSSEGGCPIELEKIEVEKCDDTFDKSCEGGQFLPFHRSWYSKSTGQSPNRPREQLNIVTSWIDGSVVYSSSEPWANALRAFTNGTLGSRGDPGMPSKNTRRLPIMNSPNLINSSFPSPERLYNLGDPRSNQNLGSLVLGVLFHMWHNTLARRILSQNPTLSDEDVFQRVRRLVIASLQSIVMYEFLPAFLGRAVPPYGGYNPNLNPGVSSVFQASAFRFGHTLIPPGLYLRDEHCNFTATHTAQPAIRFCTTWWDSSAVLENNSLEDFLRGMTSQIAEREDHVFCPDLINDLFGPMSFTKRDLGALNIMRGRDNGVPDYNTVRRAFGLPKITSFEEINQDLARDDPALFRRLEELYGNVSNIDTYVGGMLESQGGPGPLFQAIILDQFLRIRDADRFWFENKDNGLFNEAEIREILRITLWDVIVNSTDVKPGQIQKEVFFWKKGDPCPQPEQLDPSKLAPCPKLGKRDFFENSEYVYFACCVFLFLVPTVCMGTAYVVVWYMRSRRRKLKLKYDKKSKDKGKDRIVVKEWLHENLKRRVKLRLGPDEAIRTLNQNGESLRSVHFEKVDSLLVEVSTGGKKAVILVRVSGDHDMVLQFDSTGSRTKFLTKLENFLNSFQKTVKFVKTPLEALYAKAQTKEKRDRCLEHFFREAYALTFGLQPSERRKLHDVPSDVALVMRTSITRQEFAGALGMKTGSLFVRRMFNVIDRDQDERISFQEFLDTVVSFSRGGVGEKMRIIFDMCDDNRDGAVERGDLADLLRSLLDIAKTSKMTEDDVTDLIEAMFRSSGLGDKPLLDFDDFRELMKGSNANFVGLHLKGMKQNYLDAPENFTIQGKGSQSAQGGQTVRQWLNTVSTYMEEYRQHTFYVFIFFVIVVGLFVERYTFYALLSENTDLRHIMGPGIAVTRGAAASLSFCYSLLLLTMSRNLLTKLKEYSIHQFIPLDSHVGFHKIVALTALAFSLLHTCGHMVNFYHVSTQPADHIRCLVNHLGYDSPEPPNFLFWLFETMTGVTGVLLYIIMCVIFVFSHPSVRLHAYKYFWRCHYLYIALFGLNLLHGLARLTGSPRFWMFFVGPAVIFTFDQILTLRTRYLELDVLESQLLPSDVTRIRFFRPPGFKYLSGQWVKLNMTGIQPTEFHSFTLTSAPHEKFLQVHVKAQGPWTWKLRSYYDPCHLGDHSNGKIRIEGPFGGGNQDWFKFEVAVMIGGGIGVTPYASMLKDLVYGTSTDSYSGVFCKKVYFLWVCQSHRSFEWFVDLLKDIESKDVTGVLEIHIFVTQFFHKFDLRTTMLFICEKHFQRLSHRSLFTGLKASNHFGRPDLPAFFRFVQKKHGYVSKVGVFSCGPVALTKGVRKACDEVNKGRKLPYFVHHFENFG